MARKVTGFCSFDGRFFDTKEAVTQYETAIKLYETLDDLLGRISAAIGDGYNADYMRNHFTEHNVVEAQNALRTYIATNAETIAAYIKARPDLTSNRNTPANTTGKVTDTVSASDRYRVTKTEPSSKRVAEDQSLVGGQSTADNEGDGT